MIVVVTRFRLAEGTTEEAFLAADEAAHKEFANFQPGIVRRTTAKGEDGWWLIELIWWSREAQEAADVAAAAAPQTQALRACVDTRTAERHVYETIS